LYLSDRNRRKRIGKELAVYSQLLLSLGAPDSVRCARLASGELAALGKTLAAYGYNSPDCPVVHRTVRWCTGLSDEPTAASATVGRQIRGRRVARSNGRKGHRTIRCAPDSVRCANRRQSCNGQLRQIRKEIRTGHATVPVRWCTRLSGVPPDRRQDLPSKIASNGS
jgi:hypothetical protein